jgi:nucleoside-diphosphate-sugar epimerase
LTTEVGLPLLCSDVTDQAGVTALLQQLECTGLIHCAGFYAWWSPDHSQYDNINLLGTKAVMEAARAAGVRRIVHVSTILAHGSLEGVGSADKPLTPDMPIGEQRSKALGTRSTRS